MNNYIKPALEVLDIELENYMLAGDSNSISVASDYDDLENAM